MKKKNVFPIKEIFIDGRHDYTVEVKDNNTFLLYYSLSEAWCNPGDLVMTVKNTGNGYKIQQKRKNFLEYDEGLEINILFRVMFLLDNYKFEMVDRKIDL